MSESSRGRSPGCLPCAALRRLAGALQASLGQRAPAIRSGALLGTDAGSPVTLDAGELLDKVAEASAAQAARLSKKLQGLRAQIRDPAEAEDWRAKGNGLLAMPPEQWQKGLKEVEVPCSDAPGGGPASKRVVKLKADKDFAQNAELCFKEAQKIEKMSEKVRPLLEEGEASLLRWQSDAAQAAAWQRERAAAGALSAASREGVLRLYNLMIEEEVIKRPKQPEVEDAAAEAQRAFKRKYGRDVDCYLSPSGHEVVCGRSSNRNEYISLQLNEPDNMWFHADNGTKGSHVLIRAHWDAITDEDILFAARIAAHHSKAKNASEAQVMYCRGQDVHKNQGDPEGRVRIRGQRHPIVVRPGLPDDERRG